MISPAQLTSVLQPFLMLLNNGVEIPSLQTQNITLFNATQNTTVDTTPLAMPTDFSSLITFIYSFSAPHGYLKLIVLGGALETFRRLSSASCANLMDWFLITATFDSDDLSFEWVMFWLSSLPQFRQFRDFSISTSNFSLGDDALEFDDEIDENTRKRTRPVRYLPSYASSYRMWYKGRYITISRTKEEGRWFSQKSVLQITIFSRDRSVLDSLILEAKQKWLSARSDKIYIFAAEGLGHSCDWTHIASRPKRPLHSIVLDEGVKELLLEDARDFLKSKRWYADRGIPFRRGYLLYGAPGSGKTSIIHSLAGELGLDVYIISLSKDGLDDSTMNSLISSLPERCIAIMEDIDAAFTHGLTRDTTGTELEDPRHLDPLRRNRDDVREDETGRGGQNRVDPPGGVSSRITLSGLLNALDGISAQEGRLLFATTNRYHTLDPALTRPGRMDLHVEFRLASRYQAKELYKHFYVLGAPEETAEDEDEGSGDSGYVTPTKEGGIDSVPFIVPKNVVGSEELPPKYHGTGHAARAPTLSMKELEQLAEQFSALIPERELSMATLQGYLMSYKTRPFQAVDDVERWVKEAQDAQDRRAEARAVARGRS